MKALQRTHMCHAFLMLLLLSVWLSQVSKRNRTTRMIVRHDDAVMHYEGTLLICRHNSTTKVLAKCQ
jgi:hypothetical protein